MLARLAYALIFCVAVPALLVGWSYALDHKLPALPPIAPHANGLILVVLGAVLMARAMWDLWRRGGGLPMNAFPPTRFVASGAYRWVTHPIYFGFGLAVPGVALAVGSAAGLWVATPVVWLAMIALVLGYERIDLARRFGPVRTGAWLSRPTDTTESPTLAERTATAVLAYAPWLVGYAACLRLTTGRNDLDTMLPLEHGWPVWEWTAVFYLGAYAWTAAAPFIVTERRALRRFVRTAWSGTALIVVCFLAFPFMAAPRPIDGTTFWGQCLLADRSLDTAACAWPSFHVFWAFAAAALWSCRLGAFASYGVAIAIAASCVACGVHSLADVVAGVLAWMAASRSDALWRKLCAGAEHVANSWRDWHIGPVRIINHGGYVAAATALGLIVVGQLLGPSATPAIVVVAASAIVGAGAWGQWLEASSQLSRPFGYFGGLFGGCVGVVIAHLIWGNGWLLAGAFAVAAPFIQAVGRLRCLVQGCCHGAPVTGAVIGIRYHQPLSRVCKLARLAGVPVHPTPLYSIVGNLVIGALLARLWREGADLAFITGGYFVLSTCARFIEEGYRGEPQTVHWAGLPIYQWLAIGCLLAGVGFSICPAAAAPPPAGWSLGPLAYALPFGLLVWGAMGVDFPESNRRMSRLA